MMYVPHVPHFEVHLSCLIFGVLQELQQGSFPCARGPDGSDGSDGPDG